MKTTRALRECAEWLSFCLSIGWRRDMLDELETLWWKYHDHTGKLIENTKAR